MTLRQHYARPPPPRHHPATHTTPGPAAAPAHTSPARGPSPAARVRPAPPDPWLPGRCRRQRRWARSC